MLKNRYMLELSPNTIKSYVHKYAGRKTYLKRICQFEDKSLIDKKLKVNSENDQVTLTKSAMKTKNYIHSQYNSSEFQNPQM